MSAKAKKLVLIHREASVYADKRVHLTPLVSDVIEDILRSKLSKQLQGPRETIDRPIIEDALSHGHGKEIATQTEEEETVATIKSETSRINAPIFSFEYDDHEDMVGKLDQFFAMEFDKGNLAVSRLKSRLLEDEIVRETDTITAKQERALADMSSWRRELQRYM
jgi:hypothetical protein